MSMSGSKIREQVAHFLVDIHSHSIPRMEEGAELAVKLAAETKQKLAAGKEA